VTRLFPPVAAADYDPPGANIREIYRWIDNVEASDGVNMTDPEIRASNSLHTPLGNSLKYARLYFQRYVIPLESPRHLPQEHRHPGDRRRRDLQR
jgi:hypothetical protein